MLPPESGAAAGNGGCPATSSTAASTRGRTAEDTTWVEVLSTRVSSTSSARAFAAYGRRQCS